MNSNKHLVEAVMDAPANLPDAGAKAFMKRMKNQNHPYLERFEENFAKAINDGTLLEYRIDSGVSKAEAEIEIGALRGQTVGDAVGAGTGMQVAATLEIFNAVVRGYRRYMDDSFVKKYTTESVVFKVPKLEYQEYVAAISAGQFPHTEKLIDYAVVDLSNPESEKGGKVTWTRSLLEDVTFDVQAEMAEGLGHAIAAKMMKDILATLQSVTVGNQPYGSTVSLTSGAIKWSEFLTVVGAVDIGITDPIDGVTTRSYGPADYCLVATDRYWELLNVIQMTNVLYEGSTDPVKKGVIKLALGVDIVKESLLPKGTIVALNSEKAIALVTRRALKIEPVLFPVWNEYGFIGSVRYGTTLIFEQAIQMGV